MSVPTTTPSRFELLRRLGEGAMGVVYEARDRERGARVALKVLQRMTAASLLRFKREFRALQDLQHPNIVALGELVCEGEDWLLTMELVDGVDFLTYVRGSAEGGRETFDEAKLRGTLAQLAQALVAMHDHGLVHRDLKPNNLRVTPDGRVVVLDFGLVADTKDARFATQADVVGTPAYMAPEQGAGSPAGPEADVYSLGVILFEALTGRLPFEGAPLQILLQKQADEPPAPSTLAPNVPRDLDLLCATLLRFDPRKRPTAAQVLQAVGGEGSASMPAARQSQTQQAPFVGRVSELSVLRSELVALHEGGARSVFLEGESGVGKSCLVQKFLASAAIEWPEVVILAGRCYERESLPYKGFDGVVDALTRFLGVQPKVETIALLPGRIAPLVQVFPVLQRVAAIAELPRAAAPMMDPIELRKRAFSTLRELFTRIADRRPLILVIDDIQWADADSLALLAELMRPPDAPALLLLATRRTDASSDAPAATRVIPGKVLTLTLARLAAEEGRDLATQLLARMGGTDAGAPDDIAREAEGHPLFIEALARHTAGGDRRPGLPRLEDALWSTITGLEPKTREVLEVLAVAGAPISHDAIAVACGEERAAIARLVSFLRVANLARSSGSRGTDVVEPYHDRIRTSVLVNLSEAEIVRIHRRIAVALESLESRDAESLAVHWRGAGDVERAARYTTTAAEQAEQALAFDRAAKLYETAIHLRPLQDEERRALHAKLGHALARTGLGALAAESFEIAARGANSADQIQLRSHAAAQLIRSGHFDAGLGVLGDVLESIGMKLPGSPLAAFFWFFVGRVIIRLRGLDFVERDTSQVAARDLMRIDVCWLVAFGLGMVDNIRGSAFQLRVLLLALRAGDASRVVLGLSSEIAYTARGGSRSRARTEKLIAHAKALGERAGSVHANAWVACASGGARYLAGDFELGLAELDHSQQMFRDHCSGVAWELDTTQFFAMSCLSFLGEMKELAQRRELYLREAIERGDLYGAVSFRTGNCVFARFASDEPAVARAEVTEAMSQWSKQGFHLEHYYALTALTNADLYEGLAREAHARVVASWGALRRSLLRTIQMVAVASASFRGRAALALAREDATKRRELLSIVEWAARDLDREKVAFATPQAALLRAGAQAVSSGDRAKITKLLRSALEGFDACDLGLYAAVTRRCLAVLVSDGEARTLIEESDAFLSAQDVKDPMKMARMLAPGLAIA